MLRDQPIARGVGDRSSGGPRRPPRGRGSDRSPSSPPSAASGSTSLPSRCSAARSGSASASACRRSSPACRRRHPAARPLGQARRRDRGRGRLWLDRFLGARYVSVVAGDGIEHRTPNEELIANRVENWSYSNDRVRLRATVGISYDADVRRAIDLCLAAARPPRVLKSPAPACLVTGFGASSVDLEVRLWIDDPVNGAANVRSAALLGIWDRLHERGIEILFPQRDLHLKSAADLRVLARASPVPPPGASRSRPSPDAGVARPFRHVRPPCCLRPSACCCARSRSTTRRRWRACWAATGSDQADRPDALSGERARAAPLDRAAHRAGQPLVPDLRRGTWALGGIGFGGSGGARRARLRARAARSGARAMQPKACAR